MKRRRCRHRHRQQQQYQLLIAELAHMRNAIDELHSTQQSHDGSIKSLFLVNGDTDYTVQRLQVKVEEHSSVLSPHQQASNAVLANLSGALKNISNLHERKL